MDLERMLEMCKRDQWKVGDLDWTGEPRELSPEDEQAVVQYFTDMAGIERLAGALFEEQRRRTKDPVLREIFTTFVVDEVRHSHAAQMLADYYNRRKLKIYQQNPSLTRFTPVFIEAVRHFSPAVATAYITGGELILDIALLRSLDDYVDDEMSHQAMALINRDESRHIAMDYYMTEYYCSEAYREELKSEPAKSLAERAKAASAFAEMIYHARPFFMEVFFRPMALVDPSNRRLFEAFKRMQMLAMKPEVARTPFAKLMSGIRDAYKKPAVRRTLGPVLLRVIGLDEKVMGDLYTGEDKRRAREMTFDEMAQEALGAKYH